MRKQKLSIWHDASTPPVHVGVYEVLEGIHLDSAYAYWNGHAFMFRWFKKYGGTPKDAYKDRNDPTNLPKYAQWRGLLK